MNITAANAIAAISLAAVGIKVILLSGAGNCDLPHVPFAHFKGSGARGQIEIRHPVEAFAKALTGPRLPAALEDFISVEQGQEVVPAKSPTQKN